MLTRLAADTRALQPLLDGLTPNAWVKDGASPTYVDQWIAVRSQVGTLTSATEGLARQPERLAKALDALFQVQGLESSFGSLMSGARRYGQESVANRMATALNGLAQQRDRLRLYVSELADTIEQERQVMHREAQRCREGVLSAPPPASNRRRSSRP